MGLSVQEKVGSRGLLELLDTADLLSLAGTVTEKKSTACTRAEAIDIILQNSQSAYELLNHIKVLCDSIATYLKNEGVFITSKITKFEVIRKTLVHWSKMEIIVNFIEVEDPVTSPSRTNLEKPVSKVAVHDDDFCPLQFNISNISSYEKEDRKEQRSPTQLQDPQEIIVNFIEVEDPVTSPSRTNLEKRVSKVAVHDDDFCPLQFNISNISSYEKEDRKEQRSPTQLQDPQTVQSRTTRSMQKTESQLANSRAKTEKVAATPGTGQHKNLTQPLTVHTAPDKRQTKEVVTSLSSTSKVEQDTAHIWPIDCEMFARDFCKWFYSLLNSQNPSSGLQKKDWGSQHFLGHAVLHLTYMSDRRKYVGSRNTSLRLLTLVQEDKLSFQPNITSGKIKCERSPKGMVVVSVGGTLLKNKTYLGPFHQVFEIVGNFIGDKWKIRSIDLKIMGGF